jgi:hypothetical protein
VRMTVHHGHDRSRRSSREQGADDVTTAGDSGRARYPSAEGASDPQASATQQMSRPSFSAPTTKSRVSSHVAFWAASTVVAVRISAAQPNVLIAATVRVIDCSNSRIRAMLGSGLGIA